MIHDQSPIAALDEHAKRVVVLARERADRLRSRVIWPEHILLALLAVRGGVAGRAMTNLIGSAKAAETAVSVDLVPGAVPSPAHIGFTQATEEAMVRAAREARLLGDDRIGAEHLLLGVLTATETRAVRRLSGLGVDYAAARAEISRLRADGTDPP